MDCSRVLRIPLGHWFFWVAVNQTRQRLIGRAQGNQRIGGHGQCGSEGCYRQEYVVLMVRCAFAQSRSQWLGQALDKGLGGAQPRNTHEVIMRRLVVPMGTQGTGGNKTTTDQCSGWKRQQRADPTTMTADADGLACSVEAPPWTAPQSTDLCRCPSPPTPRPYGTSPRKKNRTTALEYLWNLALPAACGSQNICSQSLQEQCCTSCHPSGA